MLLAFPYMHPELWSGDDLDGLTFFDPGLTDEPAPHAFRPEGLPLDPRTARALINDSIHFGEQFKDPAEMAYFGAITANDFYEGSSMSIQAQLSRQFDDGQGTKQEREARDARSKAQFVLLLAWTFEERILELVGLEEGIRNGWDAMDRSIGVDEEDSLGERETVLGETLSHTGGTSDGQEIQLPWQRVVESLPAFLPEGAELVCADPEIFEVWEEFGLSFEEGEDGLHRATAPAWKFGCRRRPPEGLPAALQELTVAILK
ncbi:hypothetical protein DND132_0309 [Pseudodesulfovibrio mercurii]|uniref:Uncharacterized protein n=1 Tax=Pseudodesulfovibrio mercurii TaxID=641491 RepID=F0JEG3_9BACT|nr:hypothetical protein [Pseudodesulfovibrio mercurii]EGB13526.1 hypothetical protein DND132_0309 [Pseudodesulfovibrio mercurii]